MAILRPADPGYPEALLALGGRSRRLRLAGDSTLLAHPRRLAVVGTRTPDAGVEALTREIAALAVARGWVVVSGLSPGVDVIAHEETLVRGGRPLAVPGCGRASLRAGDRGELVRRVERAGLVVAPFPDDAPETPARRWWRNRVIAAVCHALVVTGSEPEGGAWEAERRARDLGRRVLPPDPKSIAAALG